MNRSARAQQRSAVWLAACLLLAGTLGLTIVMRQPPPPLLERIQRSGVLVVATRQGPATYYQGASGADGFEYALVAAFARHLGVRIRFVFPDTLQALLDATERGTVHMAAAGLTVTPERRQHLAFSLPYHTVTAQMVYRRGERRPRSLAEIQPGELHLVSGSSHAESLRQLRAGDHPELAWQESPQPGPGRLLALLEGGRIRLTVADSHEIALSRRVFRHLATAFDLAGSQSIAWAFPRGSDHSLRQAADDFLLDWDRQRRLERLRARYFGHSDRLNFVDTRAFWRHVRDRLPALQPYFERAAQATGLDWRLLAAIGYQESHWLGDAVSPTGVRGIMMLTQATARQMGVEDRNDPGQSIMGGARYLQVVAKKIPERIQGPNRLWLTLAGYNIGFGHLEDARILTERQGGDPDLWLDVKQRLPLLAEKQFNSTVRYGFARGQEAVDYVDHIRNFHDLMIWYTTTSDHQTRDLLLARDDTPNPG